MTTNNTNMPSPSSPAGPGPRPRAGPRARRPRLARRHRRPRRRAARPRRRPADRRASPSPATSPTRRTGTSWPPPPPGRPPRPAGAQRQHARPAPAAGRWPTTRSPRCATSRDQRRRAARPDPARCCRRCTAADGVRVVDVSSDAAVEAYEGWGGYGAAKAALDHAHAVLAAEEPELRCTRSTPATCAPRCTRTRSPARTSPTGRCRRPSSGAAAPARRSGRRSGRYRAAGPRRTAVAMRILDERPHDRVRARPAASRRHPPSRAASTADGVRLLVAAPDGLRHTRGSRDLPDLRPGRPAGRQHLRHARRGRRRAARHGAARSCVHVATTLDDGTWVVELRTAPDAAGAGPRRAGRRAAALPGGVGSTARAATRARVVADRLGTGCGGRRCDGDLAALPGPARPPDRATATSTARYPLADLPDGLRRASPGSAEMPRAGRPFTTRARHRPGDPRGRRRADHPAHRGLVAGGRRAAAARAVRGHRTRPRALVERARAGGGRVVAVGTTVTRALESAVDADGGSVARERLDRPRGHARPTRRGSSPGWSPAGTTRGLAPAAARGRRRAGAGQRGLRRGRAPALPVARVRRRRLLLP